jgi:hypothetical protein
VPRGMLSLFVASCGRSMGSASPGPCATAGPG